ncbi:hypothetical protein, partial [Leisingera sp. MMG026]|uniref:hypothetical protein n=1 Tax=Leisingera sp. MMG026 TaxID=2909982 RepID=UPI001F32D8F7
MSEEAAKILPPDISFRKAQGRDKPCTGDHCIPLAVTAGHLMDHAEDRAVIAETMAYAWRVVLITKSEDVQLREAGLQSAMPDEWRWGDDPFMRYHAVGIR